MKLGRTEFEESGSVSRIAVLYFGIARSVELTGPSIDQNLIQKNYNKNITFTFLASLNLPQLIHNPRAQEEQIVPDHADSLKLMSDHFLLSRQLDGAIADWLRIAQQKDDVFKNDWISIKNLLHQLISLKRGWESLHAMYPEGFNYYLFLRPDLLYLDPFDLSDLMRNIDGEKGIALPAWHSFRGLNDRLAFAGPIAAQAYAKRIDLLGRFCERRPLHAERFLAFALSEAGCEICELPVRAQRVRSNAVIKREDFQASLLPLPQKAQLFKYDPPKGVSFSAQTKDVMNMQNSEEKVEPGTFATRLQRCRMPNDVLRRQAIDGVPYLDILNHLHAMHSVQRYLEIGTQKGASLRHARASAIAIDPNFLVDKKIWANRPDVHFHETTSDEFFLSKDPTKILAGAIDMAFIDGMHLAEFVLRDFINVERHSRSGSLIVLHDALPINFEMAERNRNPAGRRDTALAKHWTGDVWRLLPILAHERPDLDIKVYDCPPTGLVLITKLDPASTKLSMKKETLVKKLATEAPDENDFWEFMEALPIHNSRILLSQKCSPT